MIIKIDISIIEFFLFSDLSKLVSPMFKYNILYIYYLFINLNIWENKHNNFNKLSQLK